MELKNLLTKLTNKEEIPEHFFALEISDDVIKSAIWTVEEGHTKVIRVGPIDSWDGKDLNTLLTIIDQSISKISIDLTKDPSGVIFGLPETWIEKESIVDEKKAILKKICQDLELKPLGFVVTDTAVIKYLKIEEGTPPSAIFLRLTDSELNLSLVKIGKIIGVELVGRSGDLGPDVEEGLSRFDKIDTLPSRMILYNGKKDFEEDKQQLVSYDWEEKLPFIHFPKVESLSADTSIKSIALAGGSEVAKSLGFDIKPPLEKKDHHLEPKPTADSLGFSSKDIIQVPQEPKSIFSEASESTPLIKVKLKSTLQKIKSTINFKKAPKTLTIVIAGFTILFISLFVTYWYLPKAKIDLYIEPKIVDENLNLTIDSTKDILDLEQRILPGQLVNISVEGSKSTPTTGTSLVGDPAQGDITIYNKTYDSKTFDKGEVLVSSDNLTFTLDEEVTIASASVSTEIITFGKVTAKITAASIGPEGNLSAGVNLSFKSFSDTNYSAKIKDGLSGGTAREVKSVAEADQTNLLNDLNEYLKQKATADLQSQLGEGRALIDVKDQEELIKKSFNHDVDEQADNLKLDAQLEYTALSYQKNYLDILLEQAIKEKIPPNYEVSQNSEIEITPANLNKDNTATIKAAFKVKLIPKFNFTEIKNNLKGKYPNVIQEYLATLPGFIKADINITPKLPDRLKTLPRITKNIIIELKNN